MATIKSVNVTKYDAGGSGDYAIADGFIKSVEKVWIDTYVIDGAIPSTTSLKIAQMSQNKKVTDIIVHMPVLSAGTTSSTIYCCTGATTSTTTYFGALKPVGSVQGVNTFTSNTSCTLRLSVESDNLGTPLPTSVGIYIMIDPATVVTAGTIRSMVKYT